MDASMNALGRRPPLRASQRRNAALLVGSVVIHTAILTPLALRLFEPTIVRTEPAPDIPIFLEIEPRPLLPHEAKPAPAPQPTTRETVPTRGAVQPGRALQPPTRIQPEAALSPLVSGLETNAPAQVPRPNEEANRVPPESMRAAVARSLRTGQVGCRDVDGRLSMAEQQLCDDRFNETASRTGSLGSRAITPPERRRDEGFATQAKANDAWRAYRRGDGEYPGLGSMLTQQ